VKPKPTVYDSRGRLVPLGKVLGSGGEGAVFEAADGRGLAAKIYHDSLSADHAAKMAAMTEMAEMAASRGDELFKFLAWPVALLHRQPGGPVAGFLMPRIRGLQPIHHLYSPKSRMTGFPRANWTFLLHTAANLARAFAAVHAGGQIVIGDVNHGNVLVSDQAVVKLIDCDSVQLTVGGRSFLCGVGVSTHTPPELQGGSLRVLRTRNHDQFGLAVLIFQLLFMGRHPFSGQYLGSGDLPLEKAIKEFRFAYGRAAASRLMHRPPFAPDLSLVPSAIASLFERAFAPEGVREGGRPSADAWISALTAVKVQTCRQNAAHTFPVHLAACPWCAIESHAGVLLFSIAGLTTTVRPGGFDVNVVWAQILAVPSPTGSPGIPPRTAFQMTPSPEALARHRARLLQAALAWLFGIAGPVLAIVVAADFGDLAAPVAIVGVLLCVAHVLFERADSLRRRAQKTVEDAEAFFKVLEKTWIREASEAPFEIKRNTLEKLKDEYLGLPALRTSKIQALQADLARAQLRKFLDHHRLEHAKIPGIADARRATLQSYGIETADDVTPSALAQVPGIGPALASALLEWRKSIAARFVFNPAAKIDPRDIADVDRNLAARRSEIEKSLTSGIGELRQLSRQIILRRRALLPQITAAVQAIAQAEVDWKAV
jgi:DNA-binding helix-hairpin-helix protein with protein kinase domain